MFDKERLLFCVNAKIKQPKIFDEMKEEEKIQQNA